MVRYFNRQTRVADGQSTVNDVSSAKLATTAPGFCRRGGLSFCFKIVRSRAVWSVVAFILLGLLVVRWMDASGAPQSFQARWGNIAPLVTLSLHAFLAVSPFIPSDGLCVANGMLHGFWMGAFLSWVGWWVAGIVAFQIGARARQDLDLEQFESRLPRWLKALPIGHPLYVILVRQIPGIGGDATNISGRRG